MSWNVDVDLNCKLGSFSDYRMRVLSVIMSILGNNLLSKIDIGDNTMLESGIGIVGPGKGNTTTGNSWTF